MKERIQEQRKKAVSDLSLNREEFDEERDNYIRQYVFILTVIINLCSRLQEAKYESERIKKCMKTQQMDLLHHLTTALPTTQQEASEVTWASMTDSQLHKTIKAQIDSLHGELQHLKIEVEASKSQLRRGTDQSSELSRKLKEKEDGMSVTFKSLTDSRIEELRSSGG